MSLSVADLFSVLPEPPPAGGEQRGPTRLPWPRPRRGRSAGRDNRVHREPLELHGTSDCGVLVDRCAPAAQLDHYHQTVESRFSISLTGRV